MRAEKEELIRTATELKVTLAKKTEELGAMKSLLETERNEKNEQQGKSKQLSISFVKLEQKYEDLLKEHDALKKQIAKHDAEAKEREANEVRKSDQNAQVVQALKEERQRVIQEEQEQRKIEAEERDRMWAEHEIHVIAAMTELCKQPQLMFMHYTNTSQNLPDGFHGNFKPDFMIEFLGQYVIFDAKVSKAESLQTYINNAIKTTTEKVKKNPQIYTSIFLVVPTNAIGELKATIYSKDDYTFYVVSPEALAPILAGLKKISTYEFAEQMDPQQREAIVHIIAELDYHIGWQNAMNIAMTKRSIETLQKVQKLGPDLVDQINQKKAEKKPPVPSAAELKKMMANVLYQQGELEALVEPKAAVHKKDVDQAESLIESAFEKAVGKLPKVSAMESAQTLL